MRAPLKDASSHTGPLQPSLHHLSTLQIDCSFCSIYHHYQYVRSDIVARVTSSNANWHFPGLAANFEPGANAINAGPADSAASNRS